MNKKYIAILYVPAIGSQTGWIRTAKTIYISESTPAWVIGIISDLRKGL